MASVSVDPSASRSVVWRLVVGGVLLLLGGLAFAAPFVADKAAPFLLGLLLVAAGTLQTFQAFGVRDQRAGDARRFGGAVSILAGLLLVAWTKLVFTALILLLGLSWILDGLVKAITAVRGRGGPERFYGLLDALVNVALGVAIIIQWPLTGIWSVGVVVGLRLLAAGWSVVLGRTTAPVPGAAKDPQQHPDARLGLPPHPEVARLRADLMADAVARQRTDRYWRWMFVVTFFAIHIGRMDAEWNLVGLISPAVAVIGDLFYALVLAYVLAVPLATGWRALTRPLERRAWRRYLAGVDAGRTFLLGPLRAWLTRRLRFALWAEQARGSATAAVGRGLQIGLPLAAILIALNPVWGFSWYFNTENWATGAWEQWAEQRTDTWREHMVAGVRAEYQGDNIPAADFFRVAPEGIETGDFRFLVIGDPGEGDASQHVLRDQYLALGQHPDVKFLAIASDVIYPSGAMKHYEPNFYLPFKGFNKPVYAVPGNHDWYDTLEAFTANFLEPRAARAALRARRRADHNLTTTTEGRIDGLLREAARLRSQYGVQAARQRAPYFEIQAEGFALIVADTGILRRLDADQLRWLHEALERARGKFKFVILGHPLFAGGRYQGNDDEPFAAIHQVLRAHAVDLVMGGDTHCFEFFREPYTSAAGTRTMHHFVNGGGGAYLSIGTPLAWPVQPPVADCAHYPRADAVIAKLDQQTPLWKQPIWFWVKRLGAWPSSPEGMAAAFDYNAAPFFQSFMEVRVERSTGVVRLLLHGANGPLRWRDLQVYGQVVPEGEDGEACVEFRFDLPPVAGRK